MPPPQTQPEQSAPAGNNPGGAVAAVDPATVTFLMVGCQRCGTTWVDAALREHPQIFLPAQKQTYFFDRNYERGIGWYLENFRQAGAAYGAVGEIATGYSLPGAVERMAEHFPHIKLIMAVRHPVDRAYSNYQVRKQESGWASFEEAIERDPDLVDRGMYMKQIDSILRHYKKEDLLVLFYEDLASDDRAYLKSILSFLGVDGDFESNQIGRQRNSAMYPRTRRVMTRLGLKPVLNAVSRSALGDAIRSAKKRWGGRGYKAVAPATRSRLMETFRQDTRKLAEFTGRDLSHWEA